MTSSIPGHPTFKHETLIHTGPLVLNISSLITILESSSALTEALNAASVNNIANSPAFAPRTWGRTRCTLESFKRTASCERVWQNVHWLAV